jgi:hypothetical protein
MQYSRSFMHRGDQDDDDDDEMTATMTTTTTMMCDIGFFLFPMIGQAKFLLDAQQLSRTSAGNVGLNDRPIPDITATVKRTKIDDIWRVFQKTHPTETACRIGHLLRT